MNLFKYEPKTKMERILNNDDGYKYFVYNVSKGQDNYSQKSSKYEYIKGNFKTNGYSFCNVTMMGMGLIYLGYERMFKDKIANIYPEYSRLPDKLAKFIIENPSVLSFYKSRFPTQYLEFQSGKKDAYGPNEIHQVLSFGTNLFLGLGNVTNFSTNTSWIDIVEDVVYNGLPVGISGKFSGLNHIVLLVGVAYKDLADGTKPSLLQQPDYLIVDDPFGKTYEYNKNLSGNDIWIPFEKCVKDFKDLNNPNFKYAHRFVRPEHLGLA